MSKKSAILHSITTKALNTESVDLGPVVYVDIELEGYPMRALVHTGSPASTVSLDYVLNMLAENQPKEHNPAEWELTVRCRLRPPTINVL